MATFKTQKVVGDLGSQEVAQLISNYNHLLDVVGDLVTALKSAAGFVGDLQTKATTAETALQNTVCKLEVNPQIPLAPAPTAT